MAEIDYEYQLTPKGNQLAKVVSEETKKTTQKIYQKFDKATINNFVSSKTKSGNKQSVANKTNNVRSSGTASQIKPLPQAGEFSDMLMKIYQFLQKSFETDKIRNQIENNFAEEKILEEKRRHEKLLDSLKSLKEKNDKAFNDLQKQINSLVDRLNSSNGDGDGGVFDFDWRRRLKPGGTPNKPGGEKGKTSKGKVPKSMASRLLRGAGGALGLLSVGATYYEMINGKEKPEIEYDEDGKPIPLEPKTTAERIEQGFNGVLGTAGAASGLVTGLGMMNKAAAAPKFKGGINKAGKVYTNFHDPKTNDFMKHDKIGKMTKRLGSFIAKSKSKGWARRLLAKLTERALMPIFLRIGAMLGAGVFGNIIPGLGLAISILSAGALVWEVKKIYDAIFGENGIEEQLENEDALMDKKGVNPENSYEPIDNSFMSPEETVQSSGNPTASIPAVAKATPTVTPNAGTTLNQAQAQNNNIKMDGLTRVVSNAGGAAFVSPNSRKKSPEVAKKLEIPYVRNQEETFKRMIYYSTRVV